MPSHAAKLPEARPATAEERETWPKKACAIADAYMQQEGPRYQTTRAFAVTGLRAGRTAWTRYRRNPGFKEHCLWMEESFGVDSQASAKGKSPYAGDRRAGFLEILERSLSHQTAWQQSGLTCREMIKELRENKEFRKEYESIIFPIDPAKLTKAVVIALDAMLYQIKEEKHQAAAMNMLKNTMDRFAPKKVGRPNKSAAAKQGGISDAEAEKQGHAAYATIFGPN